MPPPPPAPCGRDQPRDRAGRDARLCEGVARPNGSGACVTPHLSRYASSVRAGAEPHRVVVGIDRPGTQGAQLVIRRHDRTALVQRFRHSGWSGRDPLRRRVARAWRRRRRPWPRCRTPPRRRDGAPHRAPAGRSRPANGARRARRVPLRDRPGSSRRSPPTAWARCRQSAARSANGIPGALAGRVAAQATRAPRPVCAPCSCMWRRMSAPRVENSASSSGPTPATSVERPGPADQRTPKVAVNPARRCASYTAEAARRCASIPRRSQAPQRPSAPCTRLATTTWLWRCGSPLRLTPWVNAARNRAAGRQHDAVGTRSPDSRDAVLFEVRERPGDGLGRAPPPRRPPRRRPPMRTAR